MKELVLQTPDQFPISVKIFEPEIPNRKLLVINSATGVRQQVYFSFAKYLAAQGFTVITYDYRGIGESKPRKMKGFEASMRIWGT
ncbi:MAG TPA: alpha/beta hydrolase, partial [Chryseobacterium sp.]|nr:alpha/beta hydrolase [Chryseobacterium sp.]